MKPRVWLSLQPKPLISLKKLFYLDKKKRELSQRKTSNIPINKRKSPHHSLSLMAIPSTKLARSGALGLPQSPAKPLVGGWGSTLPPKALQACHPRQEREDQSMSQSQTFGGNTVKYHGIFDMSPVSTLSLSDQPFEVLAVRGFEVFSHPRVFEVFLVLLPFITATILVVVERIVVVWD